MIEHHQDTESGIISTPNGQGGHTLGYTALCGAKRTHDRFSGRVADVTCKGCLAVLKALEHVNDEGRLVF